MGSRPNMRIARKACLKAESDFATWLMMAKLGSFDDLPANAQAFLISYRDRLERMAEAESKLVAVREVYESYYSEMGGLGAAPELDVSSAPESSAVARSRRPSKSPPARLAAVPSNSPAARKSLPALLIFVAIVALIAAYKFLTN